MGTRLILWLLVSLAGCVARSPDIGADGAVAAVNRHMANADDVDPAEYNVTVTEKTAKDGKRYYHVEWSLKRKVMGGLIEFWVDPATGEVVESWWYQ